MFMNELQLVVQLYERELAQSWTRRTDSVELQIVHCNLNNYRQLHRAHAHSRPVRHLGVQDLLHRGGHHQVRDHPSALLWRHRPPRVLAPTPLDADGDAPPGHEERAHGDDQDEFVAASDRREPRGV